MTVKSDIPKRKREYFKMSFLLYGNKNEISRTPRGGSQTMVTNASLEKNRLFCDIEQIRISRI